MPNQQDLQALLGDRAMIVSLIVLLLLCVGLAIFAFLNVQPSAIQLPVRYSDYGVTNTYRDRWYYLLSFPLFAVLVGALHALIAAKLLPKSRRLALGFVLLSIAVIVFGIVVTAAVMHLVRISI
jgi:hypothetical protein